MYKFGRNLPGINRGYAAGIAMTALAIVQAAPALAQDAPVAAPQDAAAAPQAAPAADSGDIVVTGSRIVRSGFQSPQPLTVISEKELQTQSTTNNIADYVNTLPALAGSTRPANSRLNLSSGQAGINQLNLRNLDNNSTGTRTLVLIDGRRSVGSTVNDIVDVNTIPQGLVKSVEIVTGGASAAYGSDAVAGVVNFILDKKYEGLKVSADSGISTYGDGGNYHLTVTGGTAFAGGRGHIIINGDIAHQDGIFNVDRDWNATGYVRFTNPAWQNGDATAPRYLTTLRQVGAANSTPGGLVTSSTGTVANSLRGVYFGQGGSVNQYQFGALTDPPISGASGPSLTQGGDWRVNDSGRRIGLMPQDSRYGVYGRLSYDILPDVELFFEGSYNRDKAVFNAGPNLSSFVLQPDNAYLINALGAAALTGIKTVTVSTTAADLPYRGVNNERKVQRYVIGADGQFQAFGKAAHWDIYAQYGRTDMFEQLTNIMNTQNMANATDVVFAQAGNSLGVAAGTIVCRSSLTAPTNGCIPLNRLGLGVANPAAFNYVLGNPYREETAEQKVAGVNLSLTPFATWAGDVSVAVGGEWREESINGSVPTQFQPIVSLDSTGKPTTTNTWSVGNYLPTIGSYNVKEAYLETVIPLGLGLEFNGAARATDYSTAGYVTTWKAGATWQPIRDIRFRVTRSRDIRAPNLNDLFAGGTASTNTGLVNPFYDKNDPSKGPQIYGYSTFTTGNPDLKPEKSDSWNIGAVITPRFLKRFNASIDYFRIEIKDAIGSFGPQDIINLCQQGNANFCQAYSQDPNDPSRLLFRSQPFNFSRQLVRGIDFEAAYLVPMGQSNLTLRGTATNYLDNVLYTGVQGSPVYQNAGVNGGQGGTPSWLFHFSATLDLPTTSITAVARGVSSGKYSASGIECQSNCPVSTTNFPTYDNNHVSGLFYADLNLTQNISWGDKQKGQFFINVTNIFNRWPLLVPETGLAANTTYSDMLGRTFRFGVRFEMR